MRKPTLVQGIGCVESGAQIVFLELLRSAPIDINGWALCTSGTARLLIGRRFGRLSPQIFIVGLSHKWFGRWLRLPLEALIAISSWVGVFANVVNVSHYGLCWGGRYSLFFHSLVIVDEESEQGWHDGRPNGLKRWMFDGCVRRAQLMVVQTEQAASQLRLYCTRRGLVLPVCRVMRPPFDGRIHAVKRRKHFTFQLFYPTSRFKHKRTALALEATVSAHAQDSSIGLVITTDREPNGLGVCKCLLETGRMSRDEVAETFASSDALLFTSEIETLGLPILEALQCGIPVIAPRLPYAVELLGEAGSYFDGDDPDVVAEAILRVRREYPAWRNKIVDRAAELKTSSYSIEQQWEALLLR